MKRLLILSGKGGTGKTTTAAAFVRFAGARAVADCDVDAPNLHLVTEISGAPEISDFARAAGSAHTYVPGRPSAWLPTQPDERSFTWMAAYFPLPF